MTSTYRKANMETEVKRDEIEIDLTELFRAILSKLFIIILIGVLFGGATYAYTKVCVKPQYTSSTQVYILNKPDKDALTISDLTFATYVAQDYKVLIVSNPVLKQVINDLDLNMTTKTLASCISVTLLENTRIIQIAVTADSPKMAKQIADKVRDVANEKTKDVMAGIEAINPVDEATTPVVPSSPKIIRNTAIAFVLGAGLTLIIVIILYIMDDTIKNQDDIERYLKLSVLASIPLDKAADTGKKKNKRSKRSKGV